MVHSGAVRPPFERDPLWYKDAIIYELHVRAFHDSNDDGIGDFRGLTQKLDHLQGLGVTAIWLLPFYPSPLKDDGYDIADYTRIHPGYGTLRDFRAFMREAGRRNLRVITELVINHTSDQHEWFQRARRSPPGSRWRNFYVWSDTPEKYEEARIIFKDFESSNWTWDPVANAYYWHRFYSHQPDLNYDNPEVKRAVLRVLEFWLDMGVSGMRLDAIPYLYEREGTNCENLPETHSFLKKLRRHVDERYQDRLLLGEANQWPEDSAAYFGDGDECHMSFHFPVMPRMYMALRMEDYFPLVDILDETPAIPDVCQWAMFLRNHDELTLEMVTDEERDYMYRMYAQDPSMRINLGIRRRLAPLLSNDRKKIELMNALLFSLPGTPVIYYGDEIGMGDNFYLGDRNGVRTPMQWSPDRNAGFSRANPQQLYLPAIIDPEYHYEGINAESQQGNPESLLWWMKRIIAVRKRFKALGRGSIEFLRPENRKVLAYVRRYEDETILVVANLSRQAQYANLELEELDGAVPIEAFGQSEFPPIVDGRYPITLSPYAFYWFSLKLQPEAGPAQGPGSREDSVPNFAARGSWHDLLRPDSRAALEGVLLGYMRRCRWFAGKARHIRSCDIEDAIPVPYPGGTAHVAFVKVEYSEGEPDTYLLPLAFGAGEDVEHVVEMHPEAMIARLNQNGHAGGDAGLLFDALAEPGFCSVLPEAIRRRRTFSRTGRRADGGISATPTRAFRETRGPARDHLQPSIVKGEQSNTSIVLGDRLILKLFRRLSQGTNPDLEIGRFLTERVAFPHTPRVAGALEYRRSAAGEPVTLGILQEFVQNQGDAWRFTLDTLGRYFEWVLAQHGQIEPPPAPRRSLLTLSQEQLPEHASEIVGTYLNLAHLLGERTAGLHRALASDRATPAFAPEAFSTIYQRSLYHSLRSGAVQAIQLLRQRRRDLPKVVEADAQVVVGLERDIIARFNAVRSRKINAKLIRVHGDYHLGQVLYTGRDFIIIDFEGEPARPLTERRLKRSPLRDVAGMLRSFHYAAYAALLGQAPMVLRPEDVPILEPWARAWHTWVSASFLQAYMEGMQGVGLLPGNPEDARILLDAFMLDKAIYEIGYELNNRPEWLPVPLQGILQLMEAEP